LRNKPMICSFFPNSTRNTQKLSTCLRPLE
jgi:hypothetical protein